MRISLLFSKQCCASMTGSLVFSLPYMMLLHRAPTDGGAYPHYHFHIEFYPPHRAKDTLKYLAGCETGAGAPSSTILQQKRRQKNSGIFALQPNYEDGVKARKGNLSLRRILDLELLLRISRIPLLEVFQNLEGFSRRSMSISGRNPPNPL